MTGRYLQFDKQCMKRASLERHVGLNNGLEILFIQIRKIGAPYTLKKLIGQQLQNTRASKLRNKFFSMIGILTYGEQFT